MTQQTPSDGIMATLKAATAEQHRQAERHEFQQRMVRGSLPREAYAEWLSQMLLIHRALEAHLDRLVEAQPPVASVFDDDRRKVPFLLDDLAFYGAQADGEALPATQRFLSLLARLAETTPLALLGALYVLEGSTNGARFIARRIREAYQLPADAGAAFVDPYGDAQPKLWRAFKEAMEQLNLSEADTHSITVAAQETFEAVEAVGGDLLAHSPHLVPPTA
jgi:heme oxygenase